MICNTVPPRGGKFYTSQPITGQWKALIKITTGKKLNFEVCGRRCNLQLGHDHRTAYRDQTPHNYNRRNMSKNVQESKEPSSNNDK